ncbi:aldose epimerase family protein [Saccharicrinis aurantiacus]|uniref:aldose epimerase family protein n=1 Tax=Saccharicrinis aurantiacus TaxID=1849719 RepID=UPI002492EE64|nr:aldose epimerase family protein [Saccharicrinis aurantiacus]
MSFKNIALSLLASLLLLACSNKRNSISEKHWGVHNGKAVKLYTLTSKTGMQVKITNYGAIVTSIMVPDKNGKQGDVVLGFDNLEQYIGPNPCFGATIGRVANRIKGASFTIDSIRYDLTKTEGDNISHGAQEFNKAVWDAEVIKDDKGVGLSMHYFSPDGSHGFPGNVDSYVSYILADSALVIKFEAITDKATHINMTNHSYFNLAGTDKNIYDHQVQINAKEYTAIDDEIVPTGEIKSLKGTDWDLSTMKPLAENIHKLNYRGYHYNYVLNKAPHLLAKVMEVQEPVSGRTMQVYTTQPGIQFYTGNAISESIIGKYGHKYGMHSAFCVETQHFPNTPNCSNFPSTLITPEMTYDETVIYKFGIME